MNSLRSAVALRTLLCDTASELAAINSTILPDGATAFDSQSDTLWRLDKTAGVVFDSLLGSGLVLKPDDSTAARWFVQQISGSSPYYSGTYGVAASTVTIAILNQWAYLGNVPSTFAVNAGGSAFVLDTASGLVTYHGPPRIVKVSVKASVLNASGATPISIHACISRSDDVVVGTTTDYSSKGEQAIVTANVTEEIAVERIMLLNPGTTLRLAFRNATNADDLTVTFYQMTVSPF